MPHATAAAEPLLEPPGVCARFHGLRVGGGSKLAYCVVTVLPTRTAPGLAESLHHRRVLAGDAVLPQPRAARRRPVEHVDDVLDADGDAVQRAAIVCRVAVRLVRSCGLLAAPSRSTSTQARTRVFEAVDALQALFQQIDRA